MLHSMYVVKKFVVIVFLKNCYRYGANKNVTMVSSCLSIVKEWLHIFAEDSVKVLSMLKVLPDIDKVVMTHIQCAQGLFFHSNLVKHLLELVEFQKERYPVLVAYLEFIYQLFMVSKVLCIFIITSSKKRLICIHNV